MGFISITISCIFNRKKTSVGITEVSVVCMANDMYFIQWITTSYYQDGYELHRNNSACIKSSWFNLVLIFCPDSTDVTKYNCVMMNAL